MSDRANMNPESLSSESRENNDYENLARFYEDAIAEEPDNLDHYWYLGLSYLLQGLETQAQGVWLSVITENPEVDFNELTYILEKEAQRQLTHNDPRKSWLIRANILEINPELSNNNLALIDLSFDLNTLDLDSLLDYPMGDDIDGVLLEKVLLKLLGIPHANVLAFAESTLEYLSDRDNFIDRAFSIAHHVSTSEKSPAFSAEIVKLCLRLKPYDFVILEQLFNYYLVAGNWDCALETAQYIHDVVTTDTFKLYSNYLIMSVLLRVGMWSQIPVLWCEYQELLSNLLQKNNIVLEPEIKTNFLNISSVLPYLHDRPGDNRKIINFISQLFQKQILAHTPDSQVSSGENSKLKIGYIAHTLRSHSVGWLSRWLLHHHDRERFDIYIYTINQPEDAITLEFFRHRGDKIRHFDYIHDPYEVAECIKADSLDILVELDSLTHNLTCQIMALKPAPIQITWLGTDASGIPGIDYFIADPYVLPHNAQDYYRETIWRLPHTYLGIDGFEVGIPTLRREDLGIEDDAPIYLSVQSGLKRHPDTIQLQMQILKAVPDSYFLIKGMGRADSIKELFMGIARQEGVDPSRLRFLPPDKDEITHRANLQIADVVLDTYPYNGATTTLEVLWMAIPLVTKVGQQFSARNSYTFMMNAGIAEGIAWSDEEYVRWGIELGNNASSRHEISDKLTLSRRNSPLWNGLAFTRDMESAFEQMRHKVV